MIMGKYSTYRKRGSSPGAAALGPPPAPELTEVSQELVSLSAVPENTGGTVRLYLSVNGSTGWLLSQETPWESVIVWGTTDDLEGFWYYSSVVGGGIQFSGESPPSNLRDLT